MSIFLIYLIIIIHINVFKGRFSFYTLHIFIIADI